MVEGIKITAKSKKAKKFKKEIVELYLWIEAFASRFSSNIVPFMLIIAFVISIPTLNSLMIRWLFSLCAIMVAIQILLSQLKVIFEKDIKVNELIRENKETIKELQKDIKKLKKLKKGGAK